MSETITLPKSGIVMTRRGRQALWSFVAPGVSLWLSRTEDDWDAWSGDDSMDSLEDAPRDQAIAYLDSAVLELRAALLPADARERVAKALIDQHREMYEPNGEPDAVALRDAGIYADAVLAALGGQP